MKKALMLGVLALMLVSLVGVVSATTCASLETTFVGGKVYEQGNPSNVIEGASVDVECNGTHEYATSEADGSYVVQFSSSECGCEDEVTVSATKDSLTGENSGSIDTCESETIGCIDFTINVGCVDVPMIPEFGLVVGVLTVLSAVTVFFIVRRK